MTGEAPVPPQGDSLASAESVMRAYTSRSEEAAVRLLRVAGLLQVRIGRVLKHYGLSPAAHDVLCVLRDAGGVLASRRVAEAMSSASPDLTRLLRRLEEAGLVGRSQDAKDKRVLMVSLTDAGRLRLDAVAGPMQSLHKQVMGRLKKGDRKDLVRILAELEASGESRV